MTLLIVSFLSGILTVLAPCILPLLPVVVGASTSGRSRYTPYVVVGSLSLSIILFTYVLKASTVFITVPQSFWTFLSGGIIAVFGLTLLIPQLWEKIPFVSKLSIGSNKTLGKGYGKKTFWGDVIVGASLGPIFSTCSPTYFVILATVLPASFALGSLYLFTYTAGLALVLLLIARLGERFVSKLSVLSNSRGLFKRVVGLLFIMLGLAIMFGLEKKFETKLIESNFFDVTKLEIQLLKKLEETIEKSAEPEAVEEASGATWGSLPLTSDGVPQESSLTCGSSSSSTVCVSSRDIVPVEQRVDPQVTQTIPKVTPAPLKAPSAQKYVEIVNPSGFVNSNNKPISIGEHVGKQVILLNVMTYSCSNCQATFPYVNTWYEMYKDEGLIVIGLHTPEFAFEKDKQNVTDAMKKFGITYPVVMDNEYSTWNALDNRFWPRKYLIDIHGDVVFDHIGEGAYEETEKKIKELLLERRKVLRL